MTKLICVWLHRGQHPALATRHSIWHSGVMHTHMWGWYPYNIYASGLASPWPNRNAIKVKRPDGSDVATTDLTVNKREDGTTAYTASWME